MSGRTAFSNIMGIVLQGVDTVIGDRASQAHGPLLEKAVLLSLEIILLVFDKDLFLADFWRPLYQVKHFPSVSCTFYMCADLFNLSCSRWM